MYNHLNRLWQGELVRKVSVEGIPDRYGRIRRHGHPVCNSCVRLPDTDLGDLTAQLEEKAGAEIERDKKAELMREIQELNQAYARLK